MNADSTQFTFHLHKGVKFHNVAPVKGREFTSEDVKAQLSSATGRRRHRRTSGRWSRRCEFPDKYTASSSSISRVADFPHEHRGVVAHGCAEIIADLELLDEQGDRHRAVPPAGVDPEGALGLRQAPRLLREGAAIHRPRRSPSSKTTPPCSGAGFLTNNWFILDRRATKTTRGHAREGRTTRCTTSADERVGTNTNGIHFQMKNPKFQDVRVRRACSMGIDRVEWDARSVQRRGRRVLGAPDSVALHPRDAADAGYAGRSGTSSTPAEASKLLQAAGYTAANKLSMDMPVWYARNEYSRDADADARQASRRSSSSFRQVDNPTAVQMLNDRNFEDTMNITWGPPGLLRRPGRCTRSTTRRAA